jgi:hypothetical protein
MADYSELIAQLESAETRDECVAAFNAVDKALRPHTKHLFVQWLSLAENNGVNAISDKESFSYLLLAAMEMKPEGWWWKLVETEEGLYPHAYASIGPASNKVKLGRSGQDWQVLPRYPCTALAAACLRAKEAQSDEISQD